MLKKDTRRLPRNDGKKKKIVYIIEMVKTNNITR